MVIISRVSMTTKKKLMMKQNACHFARKMTNAPGTLMIRHQDFASTSGLVLQSMKIVRIVSVVNQAATYHKKV